MSAVDDAGLQVLLDSPAAADPLLGALGLALAQHGIVRSPSALRAGLPVAGRVTPELAIRAARANGCNASLALRPLAQISELLLPVILLLRDGGAALLVAREADGRLALQFPETGSSTQSVAPADLEPRYLMGSYAED